MIFDTCSFLKSIPFVAAVPTPKFPFIVVVPDTFKDDNNVVALFKRVVPETFNEDINVVMLFNVVEPETAVGKVR